MFKNDPKTMCRQHLLGEHNEIHKHRHNFVKKHKMHNRILWGQIDAHNMKKRHDLLAEEMLRRGYKHKSPYEQPDVGYLPELEVSLMNSFGKCEECKKRSLEE
jgi:hypothetical protein